MGKFVTEVNNVELKMSYIGLCEECSFTTQETVVNLHARIRTKEERLKSAHRICVSCTGCAPTEPVHCESIDCQWFYARQKASTGLELIPMFEQLAQELEALQTDSENESEGEKSADSDIYVEDILSADDEVYAPLHHIEND